KIIDPVCILITGASGGIGSALALEYAAPGKKLILQGRNPLRLQELAADCRARGAEVTVKLLDLRDRAALQQWLAGLCEAGEVPDLVVVNAGLNTDTGQHGEGEPWEEVEALIEVNV